MRAVDPDGTFSVNSENGDKRHSKTGDNWNTTQMKHVTSTARDERLERNSNVKRACVACVCVCWNFLRTLESARQEKRDTWSARGMNHL